MLMRKALIFYAVILISFCLMACKHEIKPVQMDFKVSSQGQLMSGNKPYKIIEEKGFKQQELYDMVKKNVMKVYQDPKSVMTEDAPTSLTVNGYQANLFHYWEVGTKNVSATYSINFEFKDGKIKVSPTMGVVDYDDHIGDYSGMNFNEFYYSLITRYTGKIPSSFKKDYDNINNTMNAIMNALLWGDGSKSSKEDEDW